MLEVTQRSLFHNEEDHQANHCRTCQTETNEILLSPCNCQGSLKYIHGSCLNKWFQRRQKLYPGKFEQEEKILKTNCEFCLSTISFKNQKKLICHDKKTLLLLTFFQIFWNYEFYQLAKNNLHDIFHQKSTFQYLFWYIVVVANIFGLIYLRYSVKIKSTAFFKNSTAFVGEINPEYCKSCLENDERELLTFCNCQNRKFHKACFVSEIKMFCEENDSKKELKYVICRFCSQKTEFEQQKEFNIDKDVFKIGGILLALLIWDLCFMILNLKIIKVGFAEEARSMLFFTYLNYCIGGIIYRQFKKSMVKTLTFKGEPSGINT